MSKTYTSVSLFSGAGGMDVGFSNAGFDIKFANDFDHYACNTYNKNHKHVCEFGDLRDFKSSLKHYAGVDLVFGGPPCQGFSVAGKMDPDDIRSELIWDFQDVVKRLKPQLFICENVKALAVNSRWSWVRDGLIEQYQNMGYTTGLIILKASDFGVPQARERMFLIGINQKSKRVDRQQFENAIHARLNTQRKTPKTIRQVIKKLGRVGSEGNSRACSAIITYAKNPVLRKSPYAGMLFNGAGRPIESDGVALTLPASMGGNKTPIVDDGEIFENKSSFVEKYHKYLLKGHAPKEGLAPPRLRRITVDEALAIQTFPQTYKLAGGQSAMYRQIGNAVPCQLAQVVAQMGRDLIEFGLEKFVSYYHVHLQDAYQGDLAIA